MATDGRVQRVSSEIRKLISLLLRTRIKDPNLSGATITDVELSKDLSYAKVYYTCLNVENIDSISKSFERSKGFFRSSIAKSLNLRIVPNLNFIYDSSLDYGMSMEEKIKQARESDAKVIKQDENSLQEHYKNKNKEDKVEKLR